MAQMANRAGKKKTQTSGIGNRDLNRSSHSDRGFTLVEVLLVVFIIGLASSAVVMSVPSRGSDVQEEVVRLERTLDELAARAVLTGEFIALEMSTRRYQASRWVAGGWVPLHNGDHEIAEDVRLSVRGEPSETNVWTIVFDPAGFPLETSIELRGRGEAGEIVRVREDVTGARR